jgi:hypothetical protein
MFYWAYDDSVIAKNADRVQLFVEDPYGVLGWVPLIDSSAQDHSAYR